MKDQQMRNLLAGIFDNKKVVVAAKTTLCSAAVASPATARLACEAGLQTCILKERVQLVAGLHANLKTLSALRELGMPFSGSVVKGVSLSGRLNMLQTLVAEQQCPYPMGSVTTLLAVAASACSIGSEQRSCARLIAAHA
jgi:hypothetical protein